MCVNLLGLCAESSLRQKQAVFLLPALLRLVVTAERRVNPTTWLEHVNAVVGCPVRSYDSDVLLDDLNSETRDVVVLCELSEILWLKTVVEVYCECEDETVRYEVVLKWEFHCSVASDLQCFPNSSRTSTKPSRFLAFRLFPRDWKPSPSRARRTSRTAFPSKCPPSPPIFVISSGGRFVLLSLPVGTTFTSCATIACSACCPCPTCNTPSCRFPRFVWSSRT